MMVDVLSYIAGLMLIAGAVFSLLAVVGVLRLPDLYTRMHAASKAGAVGSGLVLLAIALVAFDAAVILRACMGIVFFMLTAPISAHLLSRAAYMAGYKPGPETILDELEEQSSFTSKE